MQENLLDQIRQSLAEGQLEAAGELLRLAGRQEPDSLPLLHQLGLWLAMQQRFDQALAVLAPLELRWQDPGYLNDLGIVLMELNHLPDAITRFARALQLSPENAGYRLNLADAHQLRAGQLQEQKQYRQALGHWQALLMISPERPDAWIQAAQAFAELGHDQQAEAALLEALRLKPDSAIAAYNLGNLYYRRQDYPQAKSWLLKSVELNPDFAPGWINLGLADYELTEYSEALQACQQAVQLEPDNPRFHIHYADALLMNQHYSEGFAQIQWRFQDPLYSQFQFAAQPWQGQDLSHQILRVQSEQGLGDVLLFSRLIPWLHQRWPDARIQFQGPEILQGLFKHWDWLEWVNSQSASPDWAVALLSLAERLELDPFTLTQRPDQPPYLQASGQMSAFLRQQIKQAPEVADQRLKIGMVWSSGPGQTRAKRSLPLSTLLPVFKAFPEFDFYSLQKGEQADELKLLVETGQVSDVIDLGPWLQNFNDTAHALNQLDLLIAVDTSVAHLAGALNLPVWILLPFAPDWRWQASGADCLWYPSARLLRQPRSGDWAGLVKEVLIPALKTL